MNEHSSHICRFIDQFEPNLSWEILYIPVIICAVAVYAPEVTPVGNCQAQHKRNRSTSDAGKGQMGKKLYGF
ncbi:MAG: hypothetical protein A3I43_05675 [Omnitrophica WOR_2 bacterium RIFCSPLOWO2_02_FULL_50_19]|nr:MAG: hypothetical protein A3I43_05675 [Omnitrophica WOR_2 bacterium RIFCSPLOWO2_02_FULL_50_19]